MRTKNAGRFLISLMQMICKTIKRFLEILSVPTLRGEDFSLLFLLFAYELLFLIKQIHCIGDSLNFLNMSLSD